MNATDEKRNETLFDILKSDCEWRSETRVPKMIICKATKLSCIQKNCVPFKFCLFFNKPEIRS
jgi:hypothetical protein